MALDAFLGGAQQGMGFGDLVSKRKQGGALGGAAKGAAAGAAGGPVGAAVGAVLGVAQGLFGLKAKREEERRKAELAGAQMRAQATQRGQQALTSGQQAAFQQLLSGARGALL